jgi:hypothetical protein
MPQILGQAFVIAEVRARLQAATVQTDGSSLSICSRRKIRLVQGLAQL